MEPHDNQLGTLACDAVRFTLPLYEMARMRAATCPRRDGAGVFAGDGPDSALRWINTVTHVRTLLGPQHRQVVTPNNDTLYTNAWLDLSGGPLLLDVPDCHGRYYVLGLLDAIPTVRLYRHPHHRHARRHVAAAWASLAGRGAGRRNAAALPHQRGLDHRPHPGRWRSRFAGCTCPAGWNPPAPARRHQCSNRIRCWHASRRAASRSRPLRRGRHPACCARPPPAAEAELVRTFAPAGIGSNAPLTGAQRAALATARRRSTRNGPRPGPPRWVAAGSCRWKSAPRSAPTTLCAPKWRATTSVR